MAGGRVLPRVSVVMCCFNAERWLEEAVESVLNQTFPDFEFIIVDDGSTDGTSHILERFAASDRRLCLIIKPNTGLTDSLNVGLGKARGEWIARLDADDICEPQRLEAQLQYVERRTEIVICGSSLTEINAQGERLNTYRYPCSHSALLGHLHRGRSAPPHSSAFYRSAAARAVGGYRTRLRRAQDRDLWLRLSEVGELACHADPLVRVRKHSQQISHEEGGRRQLVDGMVAAVSYYLRLGGVADPVVSEDPQFREFLEWLEQRLTVSRVIEERCFRAEVKGSFSTAPTLAAKASCVLRLIATPQFTARWLHERMVGCDLAQILAKEWKAMSNC